MARIQMQAKAHAITGDGLTIRQSVLNNMAIGHAVIHDLNFSRSVAPGLRLHDVAGARATLQQLFAPRLVMLDCALPRANLQALNAPGLRIRGSDLHGAFLDEARIQHGQIMQSNFTGSSLWDVRATDLDVDDYAATFAGSDVGAKADARQASPRQPWREQVGRTGRQTVD